MGLGRIVQFYALRLKKKNKKKWISGCKYFLEKSNVPQLLDLLSVLCQNVVFTVRLGLLIKINLILIPPRGENNRAAPLGVTALQGSRSWEEAPTFTAQKV